ncbi:RNA polymerase sigma-70 factor (ECF subfamily) [Ancylomarina subtilis]|uniref:RNA polymerase sigma-70 factor (ECF subfamily) n=1 Tax=Ancylomarina subtilis TaxID=1639035 RepID=A0A4Q7VHT4_9BACT|nr:RNA polymerase sigma factor [Ancylomarina subtilis]RZT95649.1 RNA polymerase sigma-70 factor (ECF subfamily) [Ancylomarina subtilis]
MKDKKLEQLIKDSIKGKSKAQECLYLEYSPKMMGVCLRYAKSYDEAEDILHDGFIKIFQSLKSFRFEGSFEGWMRRIIVNTALERFRSKTQLHPVEEFDDIEEDEELDVKDAPLDVLLNFIQDLPERYRMVFSLYVLDGYPHNEIAEVMQISVGTSKSNLARARSILKSKLIAYWDDQDCKSNLRIC